MEWDICYEVEYGIVHPSSSTGVDVSDSNKNLPSVYIDPCLALKRTVPLAFIVNISTIVHTICSLPVISTCVHAVLRSPEEDAQCTATNGGALEIDR